LGRVPCSTSSSFVSNLLCGGAQYGKAIAVLRDEINTALKSAMKARDARRVSTLRLVSAAIKNADIEAQVHGRQSLADDDLLALLQKMIKQRQESVEIYDKAARQELADQERAEIEIIRAYLPVQMSELEVKAAIAEIITEVGAVSIKDMGKVMAALKQGYAGKMDFGKASGLVKGMLAG
jgi:uncharacterized protein YqeY